MRSSVLLLYDTQGALIPGLELVNDDAITPIDAQAKTVVVRHPASTSVFITYHNVAHMAPHCAERYNYINDNSLPAFSYATIWLN
ncbi:hypothetical protein N7U66_03345 [Lacinutrix neustonica]|uniref:Uncharacterized protein n=1 Tax=Lacinutrix neustonica TaxID=2980107 RepID=A0A9E8SEW2_9FLAO|nr:hypothetical protein [Lacinutrix neustonica]WAC02719.1 hypothetical protein N7U66_03345 [Lacinutrix neustonica]